MQLTKQKMNWIWKVPPGNSLEVGEGGEEVEPGIEVWDSDSAEEATMLQFENEEEVDNGAGEQTDETVASTSTEFFTPAESPANLSADGNSGEEAEAPNAAANLSSDSNSEEEAEAPSAFSARRLKRLRRGREYLTYEKMGEPKITRYTMLGIQHKPPRLFKP